MAQEKQRKQLILTDDKNIFTYCFQPIQRLQRNFTTDCRKNFMAQQKQRKQLILTNDNNIFTYCFQPLQRLQPNFTTDGIRNFMELHIQRKQLILIDDKNIFTYCFQSMQRLQLLPIFSFIQQRQRIQPNFMNYTYQKNKHNSNNQSNISVGFTTNTKFMLLQLRQRKFWSIHIQISQ